MSEIKIKTRITKTACRGGPQEQVSVDEVLAMGICSFFEIWAVSDGTDLGMADTTHQDGS